MDTFDQRIAAIAATSDDVFTRADVLRAGGTDRQITARLRQRRWQLLFDGVYLLGAAPPTWPQRLRAGVLACGDGSGASHAAGIRNHGITGAEKYDAIQVTMPQNQRPEPAGIKVYRSRRPLRHLRVLNGVTTASVERCLIDFAAIGTEEEVEQAVESALDQNKTTEDRIWDALVREGGRGVPGSRLLRRVMLLRPRGNAKSVLEIRMGHVLRDAGFGQFVRNLRVNDRTEKVDAGFAAEKVAVEADSRQFHSTRTQRLRDKQRQEGLEALGWLFVRTTFEEVYLRPEQFVARVRAALESRRQAA